MTRRACVIGWPVKHSRSPLIHGYWLKKYGIDGSYTREAVTPEDFLAFVRSMPERGYCGGNVTVPHKEAAFRLADEVSSEVRAVEAANTLVVKESRIGAMNTDIYGFTTHLTWMAPNWHRNKRPVVVLGSGGAARAVAYAVLQTGINKVRICNRTMERAVLLAGIFGAKVEVVGWEEREDALAGAGLLVNTTTLGMAGAPPLDIRLDALPRDAVVMDIVYVPLETPLLREARRRGLLAVDGLGMLLHQAVPGFTAWFSVKPEVTPELCALVAADIPA